MSVVYRPRTIDEFLAALQELKELHGGDCRVLMQEPGSFNFGDVRCYVEKARKNNPYRLAQRGGVPFVSLRLL